MNGEAIDGLDQRGALPTGSDSSPVSRDFVASLTKNRWVRILGVAFVMYVLAFVNGVGNLGGTIGPHFFGVVRMHTGSFSMALAIGGLSPLLSALVAIPIRMRQRPQS